MNSIYLVVYEDRRHDDYYTVFEDFNEACAEAWSIAKLSGYEFAEKTYNKVVALRLSLFSRWEDGPHIYVYELKVKETKSGH